MDTNSRSAVMIGNGAWRNNEAPIDSYNLFDLLNRFFFKFGSMASSWFYKGEAWFSRSGKNFSYVVNHCELNSILEASHTVSSSRVTEDALPVPDTANPSWTT
ncbi:hypothetical protein RRG08_048578 [Elysia crispata]|uniref:Uncharacterized protein n=1 Tax=Elysia crispata TaxID=231223 RepID=A0AAE1B5Y8_9GAST|nr:hypothetical protein RRG08_048578 [Elysia crispata]